MEISEIIIGSAGSLLRTQRQDGSFAPGHNGPYYDEELPLRNTAHMLMLLLKAHELTGEKRYRDDALRALEYITASERRPMGATFWVRKNPEKDFSNGLVGQAWVIESLAYAAEYLGDDRLKGIAEEVFMLHPFDEKMSRWRIVNVDGSYGPVDMTFNHQLWFAAAGSFLSGNPLVKERIQNFLDKLDLNLETYRNGLVVHRLGRDQNLKARLKQLIKAKLLEKEESSYMNEGINKAIGYHAFNTYGFCLLYQNTREHMFWKSGVFSRVLKFLLTDSYKEGLDYFVPDVARKGKMLPFNRFGYPYNPPGIEVAFTVQTFRDHYGDGYEKLIGMWLNRQMERTFDPDSGLMNRHTDDGVTLAVRMYEAVRLKDYEFESNSVN